MKKLLFFLILISFSYSQTWNLVGGRLLPANRYYVVDLRRNGLGTGFVVGYFNPTSPDSGSLRFYIGELQYYDGAVWQTLGTGGAATSFTKQQIDTVGTVVSGIWHATAIDTTYSNSVAHLTAKLPMIAIRYNSKDFQISADTSTRFTGLATDNDRIQDSLAHIASMLDSTKLNPNIAYKTQSNTYATGTTQTMDTVKVKRLALTTGTDSLASVIFKNENRFIHTFSPYNSLNGNNLFIGENAGNFTMIGGVGASAGELIGIGRNVLQSVTTAFDNIAIGNYTLTNAKSVGYSIAIAPNALAYDTASQHSLAIGYKSQFRNQGSWGLSFGSYSADSALDAHDFIVMGSGASQSIHHGGEFIHIGGDVATFDSVDYNGTKIGFQNNYYNRNSWGVTSVGAYSEHGSAFSYSGHSYTASLGDSIAPNITTASYSLLAGSHAALGLTEGGYNVILAPFGGQSITTGGGNIIIGYGADPGSNMSNILLIGNQTTNLIYGDLSKGQIAFNSIVLDSALLILKPKTTGALGKYIFEAYQSNGTTRRSTLDTLGNLGINSFTSASGTVNGNLALTKANVILSITDDSTGIPRINWGLASSNVAIWGISRAANDLITGATATSTSLRNNNDFNISTDNGSSRALTIAKTTGITTLKGLTVNANSSVNITLSDTVAVTGKLTVTDSITAAGLRVGTSTPIILKSDGTISSGAITSTGISSMDSLGTAKINFRGGVPAQKSGEIYWDSSARAFKGWQYIVLRSFVMAHNTLLDSVYVSGTTSETNLDTITMGANYPVAGKMIESKWHGMYNAAAGTSKNFIFRLRSGGVMIDSVTVVTPAGGSSGEQVNIENTILFKTIGSAGRLHSATTVTSENGVKINSGYATANTTATVNIILSVQISDATAGNNFQLETGRTFTDN